MTRTSAIGVALSIVAACATTVSALAQQTALASQGKQHVYNAGDLYLPACRVHALVGKTGFGHEHGVTGALKSGRVVLGATRDAGKLVFDMPSFVADTDAARKFVRLEGSSSASTQEEVTANMRGAGVLNVSRYPTATFNIDSAVEVQGTAGATRRFQLTGQFTLLGATRPLSVLANVETTNGWNRIRGSFKLKQTDYGMRPFTKAFGAVGVADEMTVWGELWAAASAGTAQ